MRINIKTVKYYFRAFLRTKIMRFIRGNIMRNIHGKRISFLYIKGKTCNRNNPDKSIAQWGCCCECIHRIMVTKHCWHSNFSFKCICNEHLGFYVCIIGHLIDRNQRATLCGEHGICEMFEPIKKDRQG
jgi:hypothetical protein